MILLMLLFLAVAGITMGTAFMKIRSADTNKKDILPLLGLGVLACLIQFAEFIVEAEPAGRALASIYCISRYWIIFFVTAYMADFTRAYSEKKAVRISFHVLGVIDSLLLAVNIFVDGFVFKVQRINVFGPINFFRIYDSTWAMISHEILCGVLLSIPVLALLDKTVKSRKSFYYAKYSMIFRLVIIAVIINLMCLIFRSPIDYSILVFCLAIDIAEYLLSVYTPRKLRDQTTLLSVQQMSDVACIYDLDKKRVFANDITFVKLTPEKLDEIVDEAFRVSVLPNNIYNEVTRYNIEVDGENDGQPVKMLYGVSLRRLTYNDELIGYYLRLHDRTEEVENFKREHYRVTHDELTGVYNRAYFFEKAKELLESHPEQEYYFVLSDIDNFKLYNEIYDMDQGDAVLQNEAELLRRMSTRESVYGRLNGDEFAIIVRADRYSDELFIDCISKIRERFSDYRFKIGINAGVYKIEDHNEPIMSMYNKAMIAIDSIGEDYSTVLAHYTPELFEDTVNAHFLLDELDSSLAEDHFAMFLQPQIEAESGKWIGAEALVRWIHPERGIISPGEFVPLFEKMGVIGRVDECIWEKAAAKLHEWNLAGHEDMYISVNISGDDFYHFDLYEKFTSIVERNCIAPAQLKLEITESFMVHDGESRKAMLEKLRNYGFIVEIDDFGSGYSALNSLKDIPCDVIKVDMGFLRKSENKAQSNIILEMVIKLIKRLRKGIVTEGVETEEQVEFLRSLGCDTFQGYYYSKPVSVEEFEKKVFES